MAKGRESFFSDNRLRPPLSSPVSLFPQQIFGMLRGGRRGDTEVSPSYDPTLKTLVEASPADWLPLLGLPRRRVTVEDTDLATVVSGAVDKVLRVHARPDYLLHLDFQAGHDSAILPRRLRLYNGVLDYRHDRLVLSVAVLLRPEADSPQLTGSFERGFPGQGPIALLRYRVIRVWQLPVEQLLAGGLGTLPLAPISDVDEARVPDVVRRMKERLSRERRHQRAADLWAATYLLLGLRYSDAFADLLFQEVLGMEESTTYQAIVRKSRLAEAREILSRQGRKRFGPADEASAAALNAIEDVQRLEELSERLLDVGSWQELLKPAGRRRRNGRRQGNA
jgi:predicted transposase YdaD